MNKPPKRRRLSPPWWALGLLLLWLLAALGAPWLAPHDPQSQDIFRRLEPPFWLGGDPAFPLGTDPLGRDVLSNILYGLRVSLLVGFTAVAISVVLGTLVGLLAGYRSGSWFDSLAMRLADLQLSLPGVLVALAVLAIAGRGLLNVILIIGLVGWAPYARVVRASVLAERQKDYVNAAAALGAPTWRILLRHILPNILNPLLVQLSLDIPRAIEQEATLSFLGVGVGVDTPSLGMRISEGYPFLLSGAWWTSVLPGLALVGLVLAINALADWVRDALDPRYRGTR